MSFLCKNTAQRSRKIFFMCTLSISFYISKLFLKKRKYGKVFRDNEAYFPCLKRLFKHNLIFPFLQNHLYYKHVSIDLCSEYIVRKIHSKFYVTFTTSSQVRTFFLVLLGAMIIRKQFCFFDWIFLKIFYFKSIFY